MVLSSFPYHSTHFITTLEPALDATGCTAARRSTTGFSTSQHHPGLTWQSHCHFTAHPPGAKTRESSFTNTWDAISVINEDFQSTGKELEWCMVKKPHDVGGSRTHQVTHHNSTGILGQEVWFCHIAKLSYNEARQPIRSFSLNFSGLQTNCTSSRPWAVPAASVTQEPVNCGQDKTGFHFLLH